MLQEHHTASNKFKTTTLQEHHHLNKYKKTITGHQLYFSLAAAAAASGDICRSTTEALLLSC
jgi:hypothetical protein